MKIYCCIVIYNADILKSPSFLSLKDKNIDIIVVDNSEISNDNEYKLKGFENICYIKQNKNLGLSKAYNVALNKIFSEVENDQIDNSVFCIFDDDTEVPSDYISKLKDVFISYSEYDIFVPVITDEIGIMSPSLMVKGINQRLNDFKAYDENNIVAINSCMAVKLSVFKSYRYDENMFMDYVDFNFIRDMKAMNRKIFIMEDYKIFQNFSANIYNFEKEIVRFKIYKKDLKYYYRNDFFRFLIVVFKRKTSLCLKYKTLRFLFL